MKILPFDEDFIDLKFEAVNKAIVCFDEDFLSLKKYQDAIERSPFLHVMFDESYSIDGVRLAIGVLKNKINRAKADFCDYKIFLISNNNTPWNETLVKSGTLSQNPDKLFLTTLDSTEATVDFIGDQTFRVWARIVIDNKPYYIQKYFNHLGVSDSILKLKQEVEFLDISKLDE